ncbi:hypothetical protein LIS77_12240 [Cytobacillus firmus]|uniref:hypothetical protein n=1 Tax=Cytobacillus firmus TaxID=1399 RepID=UPI001C94E174|nr:hypothetical protein [Cytobacillus firmus]MBY6053364.1 hypothetical protein [Cytobacillus firmus]USK41223.1 hypothetical protein LIS77_12240 [Cytobacillus firmus]
MMHNSSKNYSPQQMEQLIIHLKSELQKYKSKNEEMQKELKENEDGSLKMQNEKYSDEISYLKKRLQDEEDEKEMIKNKMDQYENDIADYKSQIRNLNSSFEERLSEHIDIAKIQEQQKVQLEKELIEMKNIIGNYKIELKEITEKYTLITDEIEIYRKEKKNIKNVEQDLKKCCEIISDQETKLNLYEEKERQYKRQIEEIISSKEERYMAQIQNLINSIEENHDKNRILSEKVVQLSLLLTESENNNALVIEEYIEKIKSLERQIEEKNADLKKERAFITQKENHFTNEIERLSGLMDELEAGYIQDLNEIKAETAILKSQEKKSEEEIYRLKSKLNDFKVLNQQNKDYKELMEERESSYNRELAELKEIISSKKAVEEEHKQEIQRLREEIAQYQESAKQHEHNTRITLNSQKDTMSKYQFPQKKLDKREIHTVNGINIPPPSTGNINTLPLYNAGGNRRLPKQNALNGLNTFNPFLNGPSMMKQSSTVNPFKNQRK